MQEILDFINTNRIFSIAMLFVNILLNNQVIKMVYLKNSINIKEAKGERLEGDSLYQRCAMLVRKYAAAYERRYDKSKFYNWVKSKAKRAGFKGEHMVLSYLFLQLGLPALLFAAAFVFNFPSVRKPAAAFILMFITARMVIARRKKEIDMRLQRYGYKIYKYLHNQVSSGIKVTDAVKTVYEVIEDKDLRDILLRMAAKYELTMDIDMALEAFKSIYDTQEGESLCVAIKQGIFTGDNSSLLARQENLMFKKYFNYIQAETDACKTRILAAAVIFTAIMVIMILIPFIFEASQAIGRIFSY
ncbi:MAG: hypothetical protein GX754_05715 [Clostridiaceae bacterium]|nr:hypothetical protein [Clostridiaceae bacterium]